MKVVPFLDRSDLVHLTTHTVMHNLTEGIILVSVILFVFLGQRPRRADRHADHSVLPVVRLHLSGPAAHSGEPAVAGRARFRHDRGGRGRDDREHRAHAVASRSRCHRDGAQKISRAAHEVQRPVFYSIAIIIVAYLPIFTLQAVEGRLFKPMAWTVAFALLGALLFSMFVGPVLASSSFPKAPRSGTTR